MASIPRSSARSGASEVPVSAAIIGGVGAVGSIGSAVTDRMPPSLLRKLRLKPHNRLSRLSCKCSTPHKVQSSHTTNVGQGAVNTLAGLYGISGSGAGTGTPTAQSLDAFTQSPDYQFALQQGTQAMQRSAAAGGTLISGGQLKAGQEFGQGLASQQYGNYYNRLLSLSQLGQSAASGISNAALTTGQNVGNSIQAAGQATASGTVASASAISGGLNGVAGSLSSAALLSNPAVQRLAGVNNTSSLSSYGPSQIASIGNNAGGRYQR